MSGALIGPATPTNTTIWSPPGLPEDLSPCIGRDVETAGVAGHPVVGAVRDPDVPREVGHDALGPRDAALAVPARRVRRPIGRKRGPRRRELGDRGVTLVSGTQW